MYERTIEECCNYSYISLLIKHISFCICHVLLSHLLCGIFFLFFFLIQKNQKIKANPIAPRVLPSLLLPCVSCFINHCPLAFFDNLLNCDYTKMLPFRDGGFMHSLPKPEQGLPASQRLSPYLLHRSIHACYEWPACL